MRRRSSASGDRGALYGGYLEPAGLPGYRQAMKPHERDRLDDLSKRLREEQKGLLLVAAQSDGLPSQSTLQRVAQLELNISAIENTLADEQA